LKGLTFSLPLIFVLDPCRDIFSLSLANSVFSFFKKGDDSEDTEKSEGRFVGARLGNMTSLGETQWRDWESELAGEKGWAFPKPGVENEGKLFGTFERAGFRTQHAKY
jgi:hypothetical protein